MKRLIIAFSLIALAVGASVAHAYPDMWYNPRTGSITFINDTPSSLYAMYILSPSGRITGTALNIPGATLGTNDQPMALHYLSVPPGGHTIGNVVQPGTPATEISGFFYYAPLDGPFPFPIDTPEPATGLLAAMSGAALVHLARRFQSN